MFDITSVGSGTIDVFIHTDKKFVKDKKYIFPIGEKILIEKINFNTGGGGTNTAVSFSRLGLKTAYLGVVGSDNNAKIIQSELKTEKIDISLAIKTKGNSGYSIIMDAEKTDRTIFAYKGVNDNFKFSKINKNKLRNTKLIYLTSFTGKSYIESVKVAKFAKKNKIKLAFNPSYYIACKGYKFLKPILDCTDVLILNKEEILAIIGDKKLINYTTNNNNNNNHTNNQHKNLTQIFNKIKPYKIPIVVITDGKNGAFCFDGNKIHHSKPKKVNIVETTGAGDAFASTFVGCLIKKIPIDKSLILAQRNAESVIQYIGAKNILLKWNELNKQI